MTRTEKMSNTASRELVIRETRNKTTEEPSKPRRVNAETAREPRSQTTEEQPREQEDITRGTRNQSTQKKPRKAASNATSEMRDQEIIYQLIRSLMTPDQERTCCYDLHH